MATRATGSFSWSDEPEPHVERRRALLDAHPEIRELFGPCARTKYVCTALVGVQLLAAYSLREAPWWLIALVGYVFGGVVNHALLLAIHELSHNLAFRRPMHNRLFALFVNLPIGLPVSATFRRYHLLHHSHQGVDGVDTDIPTALEARLLRTRPRKLVWMACQALFYALRPLLVLPRAPNRWEVANFVVQLVFDALVWHFWGLRALLYMPLGTILASGLHPVAGHYLSEHYVFREGQETYSYYGPLNLVTFNVGYHNEHHDFPYIPGSRLPQLRRLAAEFYDPLYAHHSWLGTIWQYVTRPDLGGFSRVKRAPSRGPALGAGEG
ncbi:MAG TPA: fatty acid desaturase [Polyangiaceae bacterium]|nr:fatty acid desaturase [Polyangiaceae bacterium]